MKFLYQLFISLYPLAVQIFGWKNLKAKQWSEGRINIFEKLALAFANNESKVVWVHCASLGEFEQGRPVIEQLKKDYPKSKVLLTFFSPSGYEVQKNYAHADWVFYLPMDSALNARMFYDLVQPSLVIFVKYEFWFHYLQQAKQRQIPLLLISGIFRPDQTFFKWYGGFYKQIIGFFSWLLVQNEESVQLLKSIGIHENVLLSGDTRFDRVCTIAGLFQPIPIIEAFIGNAQKVIVAGSTWLEDDKELHHYAVSHPEIKFIIAPHDIQPSRLAECMGLYPNAVKFSQLEMPNEKDILITISSHQVLLIDNVGMLSRLYAYATICFVGGGFGEDGVHNVLEAAVYSKPIVFGSEYSKYKEAIDLVEADGAFSVDNTLELENILNNLLQDSDLYAKACTAAGAYVVANAGATDRILKHIYEKRLFTN